MLSATLTDNGRCPTASGNTPADQPEMTVHAPERLTENCNNKKAPGLNVFVYVKTKSHNRVLLDRNVYFFFTH